MERRPCGCVLLRLSSARSCVGGNCARTLLPVPAKEGPVPPFPDGANPDEYDRLRRRVLWKMPSGLFVVGSRSADGTKCNWMILN